MPIEHVDVNLHPTKAEVAILHEDAVIQGICASVQHILKHHHEYAFSLLCSHVCGENCLRMRRQRWCRAGVKLSKHTVVLATQSGS